MDVIIKKNDAFRVLQTITTGVISDLEKYLFFKLKDERMMFADVEDCGKTLDEVRADNGVSMDYFLTEFFGRVSLTDEIPELIKHIEFVASGSDNPCPVCGCELNQETDAEFGVEYMDTDCSNTNCSYSNTTNPDWDVLTKNQISSL
jgi:hypothetical protein